jgi:hypothetical protein
LMREGTIFSNQAMAPDYTGCGKRKAGG